MTGTMTSDEFRRIAKAKKKRNKWGNVITYVDGIKFHSIAEAERYSELKLLLQAGVISNLVLQPKFEIYPKFTDNKGKKRQNMEYIADFQYSENGVTVVEDVKGKETADFRIKMKMFLNQYRDVDFRLIKKGR